MTTNETYPLFLRAEWRYLVMLNYRIPAGILVPYAPEGTEVDLWEDSVTFISLLGFRFIRTRAFGIPIPVYADFDEINLRFYVTRRVDGHLRRGVVFMREIIARRAIAAAAKAMYNEPYTVHDTKHQVPPIDNPPRTPDTVEYSWKQPERWSRIAFTSAGPAGEIKSGSEEEFISVRHWGYTQQPDGGTTEYRVDHPRWRIWQKSDARLEADVNELVSKLKLHNAQIAETLSQPPDSAYLADGSPVTVSFPKRLPVKGDPRDLIGR